MLLTGAGGSCGEAGCRGLGVWEGDDARAGEIKGGRPEGGGGLRGRYSGPEGGDRGVRGLGTAVGLVGGTGDVR